MVDVTVSDLERYVRLVGPDPDPVLTEMGETATAEGFPYVGPTVGGALRMLARLTDAERVFEFGSGFGYSAYWIAEALPDGGEIVLTEVDAAELEQAREYLTRGGYDNLARYERGDALETIERYDGPFDLVLLDHEKERYEEAFDAVRGKLADGGVIVADNVVTAGVIEFDDLLEWADSGVVDSNDHTEGIASYLESVTSDPAFETIVLPLGEGISVSYRLEGGSDSLSENQRVE